MTRIVLVRHGQTAWNVPERFRGRADVSLDDTGLRQADATSRRIAERWRPVAIYSSPLSRAVKTAEAIGSRVGLPVGLHQGLADIDYGAWQGLSPDEVGGRWPEQLRAWYDAPQTVRVPGGESLDDLRTRCRGVLLDASQGHPGETVVLVAHTVVNRVILLLALGLPNDRFWRLRQDTCAINVIEMESGDFTLVLLNDTSHLETVAPRQA